MKSFHLFHENKDIQLLLEAIDIENFQPKDGEWSHSSNYSYFRFNVEGDDCSDCSEYKNRNSGKCYSVGFSPMSGGEVSIGFSRCGSHTDSNKNVQWALSKSILKSVVEYINLKEPKSFSWAPVGKSRRNPIQNRTVNPDARKKLYSKFFERYLFPERYVPTSQTHWVSAKEYAAKYVPDGYPPVPEGLTKDSTSAQKSHAVEEMIRKTQENRESIRRAEQARAEEEYRRRREEEERRQREEEERLQRSIEDSRYNPNQVKLNDIVVLIRLPEGDSDFRYREDYADKIAKLERFYLRRPYGQEDAEEVLYARVRSASEHDMSMDSIEFTGSTIEVPVKNLKKEDENSKRERENRIAERLNSLLANPEYNPNQIQKGDSVISYVSPNSRENNLAGTVQKITYSKSYYGSEYILLAQIDWDEESLNKIRNARYNDSASVRVKHLFKNTEANRAEIRRKIRSHEVESQTSRNRERIERRRQRDEYIARRTSTHTPEELQSLISHPNNPQNLKINDFVKITNPSSYYSRRYRNKKGTIVSLHLDAYDSTRIRIGVALHRTHRVVEFYSNELERDTSENAARIQNRQRRRQEVTQLSRGFNIGDNVRVTRGRYNGKTGTILNFRLVNGILSAIVASEERNFSVKIDFIERSQNPYGLPEMNLTFKNYISIIESF